METKTKAILKAILTLSKTEREVLLNEVKKYDSNTILEQRTFSESLQKSLGPLSDNRCPVCGR